MKETAMADPAPTPVKRFYRTTRTDCKLAGVCGGVARYLDIDPTLVRILWIVGTLLSFGTGLIAYAVFWIAAPSEDTLNPPAPPAPARVFR
jgi:phage shock protein C